MTREQLEKNIKEIIELYNNLQASLHDIYIWVKQEGDHRKHLDEFLDYIWIEKNEETRFVAYSRLINLRENSLELYLEKNNFSSEQIKNILDKSFNFVCDFHSEIQAVIITVIESKQLLTPFYLEIFKWVANVWLALNEFFLPWRHQIIYQINEWLEKKFENDSGKIIDFLNENNLFDLWHNREIADRSYSALVENNWKYESQAYAKVFEKEVKEIIKELDSFIIKLSSLEDEIYDAKQNYIDYLRAVKNAFLETDTNLLVEKWAQVDEAWMEIKTPFQISHPLEFYEDKYRKAVAPEWDLRIQNTVFESDVEESILHMYETLYDEIWREKYSSSYEFSKANFKRVQLYLTSPVLYYSSELTGLFSAQVVPNDEVITKAKWKKIFAFPEMVLENKRSDPFMKLDQVIFEENFLENYRKSLFGSDEVFYKVYDIETIGHEYGHTLWLDLDTEIIMNHKTGVFKNIEEFKATMGGLVMYFMNEKLAPDLQQDLLLHHIYRCVNLLKYREVNEIEPYYCESLIHLSILFESWIIKINWENKVEMIFSKKNYDALKQNYLSHYKQLISTYLDKKDANDFLKNYTVKQKWDYLPRSESLKTFVEYFYTEYKNIWNEIDEKSSKKNYTSK